MSRAAGPRRDEEDLPGPDLALKKPGSPHGPLLMIVETDSEFRTSLAADAEQRGLRVEGAATAADAEEMLALLRPEVALIGFSSDTGDALPLLEALAKMDPESPSLVMTEGDSFTDRVEVARAGGRGFLQKPMAPSQVIDAVMHLLELRRSAETRIVVVDDDHATVTAVRDLLERRGMSVTGTASATDFWELLAEISPDLIVLDTDMPSVDGLELCRVVRNDPGWADLPILFMIPGGKSEMIRRVFAAGADDYVQKPIVEEELLARIANRLERVRLHKQVAERDGLTGVATRRKATDAMGGLLRLANRYNEPLSLALIDLDEFKRVNDKYGHATGDSVLRALGSRLSRDFRGEDVVARWGGQEFFVGMFGMSQADGVERIAELLETFREESFWTPWGPLQVTFSAGVAQFPGDGSDLQALYRSANRALNRAKARGRDMVLPAGHEGRVAPEIALVEADEYRARVILRALQTRGRLVTWFIDPHKAIATLERSAPSPLLLLGQDLPLVDGVPVLDRLRQVGALDKTSVIMLGSADEVPDEDGSVHRMQRTFSTPVLMRNVRRVLTA